MTASLPRPARVAAAVGAAALLVLLGTACQRPVDAPSGSAAPAASAQEAGDDATPLDACALLPADQVEDLIGPNDGGVATSAPGSNGGGCVWTNEENYYSVSVDCGQTGTAVDGELPPWEPALGPEVPLPDGMREFGSNSGSVQFVADTRDCLTQVVRSASGGDLDAAVVLARQIRDEL